jgi:hypothetical protein
MDEEIDEEQAMMERNSELLVHGDDTEICCKIHGIRTTWGKLSPIAQIAFLASLDAEGQDCLLSS